MSGLLVLIMNNILKYLFKIIFYYRFIENPLQHFVDTCSVSNISVIVLPENQYGYYIHGESVHPHADANMKEFHTNLKREEQDTVLRRGLIPDKNDCQTFEILTTTEFRNTFNEKLKLPIMRERIQQQNSIVQSEQGPGLRFRK